MAMSPWKTEAERWASAAAGSGSDVGADAGGSQLHALVRLGRPPTSLLLPGDSSPWCPFYDPSPFPCAHLLDHLVRLEKEHRGDGEAERLGGLEVDDQLELRGLLHG